MDDDLRKAAAQAVVDKFRDLIEQRAGAVREKAEVDRRIRAIDRALFDCRAAGRLFGVDIELPEDVRPGLVIRPNPARTAESAAEAARNVLAHEVAHRTLFNLSGGPPKDQPAVAPSPSVPSTILPAGVEPTIRELILLYLKQAGQAGIKAAILRRRVETYFNRQIHYKTIGMSLYRLSKENPPLARREGLIWFFEPPVAGTKNPGVDAPGPIEGR